MLYLITLLSPAPTYDLLFSIDYNEKPYSDPGSTGIVIRVTHHQPKVIFTGSWREPSFIDIPSLYLCEAASGDLKEIRLQLARQPLPENGTNSVIDVRQLSSLTVDDSSIAPDSYSLSGVDFNKPYPVLGLVMGFPMPIPVLKPDTYEKCLKRVAGHQVGLTVHFIGWMILQRQSPSAWAPAQDSINESK